MALLVPRHYQTGPKAQTPAPSSPVPVKQVHVTDTDDFVTPEQIAAQIQQFTQYEGAIPTPRGWNLMVLIVALPETTEGGLIMEDVYREQKTKASPQGVVVGIGNTAYNPDDPRFPDGPWCDTGDRVLFGRYTGKPFRLANGQELAFLVDTDIIAVVDNGWLAVGGSDDT